MIVRATVPAVIPLAWLLFASGAASITIPRVVVDPLMDPSSTWPSRAPSTLSSEPLKLALLHRLSRTDLMTAIFLVEYARGTNDRQGH